MTAIPRRPRLTVEEVERAASRYIIHKLGDQLWPGLPTYDAGRDEWSVPIHACCLKSEDVLESLILNGEGEIVRAPSRLALKQTLEEAIAAGTCIVDLVAAQSVGQTHGAEQHTRQDRVRVIGEKFQKLIADSPLDVRQAFAEMKSHVDAILESIFILPVQRFSPVFGEHRVTVLSPFGKVRYPIVFEWMPFEDADGYVLSIEDADWSVRTQGTKIEVKPEEVAIEDGTEYVWKLKVMKNEEIVDRITGFFNLVARSEQEELSDLEERLQSVEPEQDRFILLTGVLEEKEFYIEAIENYKKLYASEPIDGIAYRIAFCYDKLELEELKDEWNRRIRDEGQ